MSRRGGLWGPMSETFLFVFVYYFRYFPSLPLPFPLSSSLDRVWGINIVASVFPLILSLATCVCPNILVKAKSHTLRLSAVYCLLQWRGVE